MIYLESKMKIWITKWALTKGIIETDAEDGGGWIYFGSTDRLGTSIKIGTHAHTTFEAAQAKAEKMRKAKIQSLKKQILMIKAIDLRSSHEEKNTK
jgi:hypothetical protein